MNKTVGDRAYTALSPHGSGTNFLQIFGYAASIEAFKKQLKTHLFTSIVNVL
jgi:hypothetical protein